MEECLGVRNAEWKNAIKFHLKQCYIAPTAKLLRILNVILEEIYDLSQLENHKTSGVCGSPAGNRQSIQVRFASKPVGYTWSVPCNALVSHAKPKRTLT